MLAGRERRQDSFVCGKFRVDQVGQMAQVVGLGVALALGGAVGMGTQMMVAGLGDGPAILRGRLEPAAPPGNAGRT
ncbi:MAG TPA: hypothetical protein VNF71_07295 [Acidimicrobiales bacterium]|nr:hypothetical protein [Acidimicrobiales bacterium]